MLSVSIGFAYVNSLPVPQFPAIVPVTSPQGEAPAYYGCQFANGGLKIYVGMDVAMTFARLTAGLQLG